MKISPRATLGIVFCIIFCLILVSGCASLFGPKTNSSAPPLVTGVQEPGGSTGPATPAAGGACAEGQTTCGGACRNTLVDSSNCGRCGNVCSASQYCSNGICTTGTMNVPVTGITTATMASGLTCASGQTPCSGVCRNLQADTSNCGRCGNVCGAGQTCSSGACSGGSTAGTVTTPVTTVPAPLTDSAAAVTTTTSSGGSCAYGTTRCGGICVDLNTDTNNCGGCGQVCITGATCNGIWNGGDCSCASPYANCMGACVNLNTDPHHCYQCDFSCPAGMDCVSGLCTYTGPNPCPAGLNTCGGTCVNLQTDINNCGFCGHACTNGALCYGGSSHRLSGYCSCPHLGCGYPMICVNEQTDNNNCGDCGNVCSGGQTCVAGVCTVPTTPLCPKGQTSCIGAKGSGCVDLNTDSNNCGSCGHVCTVGMFCSGGTCGYTIK